MVQNGPLDRLEFQHEFVTRVHGNGNQIIVARRVGFFAVVVVVVWIKSNAAVVQVLANEIHHATGFGTLEEQPAVLFVGRGNGIFLALAVNGSSSPHKTRRHSLSAICTTGESMAAQAKRHHQVNGSPCSFSRRRRRHGLHTQYLTDTEIARVCKPTVQGRHKQRYDLAGLEAVIDRSNDRSYLVRQVSSHGL
jgi:hypothetical protein